MDPYTVLTSVCACVYLRCVPSLSLSVCECAGVRVPMYCVCVMRVFNQLQDDVDDDGG